MNKHFLATSSVLVLWFISETTFTIWRNDIDLIQSTHQSNILDYTSITVFRLSSFEMIEWVRVFPCCQ